MTQEEKQLLLKDLCARLPYHDLWVQYDNKDWLAFGYGHERIELLSSVFSSVVGPCPLINEIKPYLRPMSSMTDEEKEEYHSQVDIDIDRTSKQLQERFETGTFDTENQFTPQYCHIDWLNAHHFDYRGLISMGLALEAPEGMYA